MYISFEESFFGVFACAAILISRLTCRSLRVNHTPVDLGELHKSLLMHLAYHSHLTSRLGGGDNTYMLLDIVRPGSSRNMETIALVDSYSTFASQWRQERGIDCETALTMLSDRLLLLPQLSTFQCKNSFCPSRSPSCIIKIVERCPEQWRKLEGHPGLLRQ
jgi:hypothetical protein